MRLSPGGAHCSTLLVPFAPSCPRAVWGQDDQSQPASESEDRARALSLFERSETEYREGHFSEAAELLRQAYELHSEPILLYNLGRALEGLGDAQGAIDAHGRYLAADGGAPDRGAIEQRVATLRRQIEERETLEREARAAERPRRRASTPDRLVEAPREGDRAASGGADTSSGRGPAPWLLTGLGVAGLVAGGTFGALALVQHSAAVDEPIGEEAAAKQDTAETFAAVSTASLIAGGVITGAGILWLVLTGSGGHERDVAALRQGVGLGSLTIASSF